MAKYFFLIVCIFLNGCAISPIGSLFDKTYFVADTHTRGENFTKIPPGSDFKITPEEAYAIATENRPQKFMWYIYADKKNYYLNSMLPFFFMTSGHARMYGVRVNGKTGKSQKCMEQ